MRDAKATLAAVGDLYLGERLAAIDERPFLAAVELLRSCDVAFANLEVSLLAQPAAGAAVAPGAWAGASAALAADVRWLGVDVVSTANNHADFGADGIAQTHAALRDCGIAQAGSGRDLDEARAPAFVGAPGARIAVVAASSSFLSHARAGRRTADVPGRAGISPLRFGTRYHVDAAAYAALARIRDGLGGDRLAGHRERALERAYAQERGDGLAFLGAQFVGGEDFRIESWPAPDDLAELTAAIAQARGEADWVVMSLHSHEYDEDPAVPAAFAREACHRFIEAGADAVLVHGEHGVRGVEIHRGRPIFHGLGAFVFQPYRYPVQPADFFEAYAMPSVPLADVYATRRRAAGFLARRRCWQALLVRLELALGTAPSFTIHPLTLWRERWQEADGIPRLADNADGLEVLREVERLSRDLGTRLELDDRAMVLRPARDAGLAVQPREEGREAT